MASLSVTSAVMDRTSEICGQLIINMLQICSVSAEITDQKILEFKGIFVQISPAEINPFLVNVPIFRSSRPEVSVKKVFTEIL